jgi:hypothetical protein
MFRLNSIRPHGAASRKKDRSAFVIENPDSPVMKARAGIGAA